MKILFVMRLAVPIHSWRDIVKELCDRGHKVRIVFDPRYSDFPQKKRDALAQFASDQNGLFDYVWARRRGDWRRHIIFPLRQLAGWRRYFFVRQSSFFRDRWIKLFPRWLAFLVRIPGMTFLIASARFGRLVERAERRAPPEPRILQQLRDFAPDALAVPVANMRYGSVDADYLKAARALGIPTAAVVFSWDSLTTKGVIPIIPDAVFLWNNSQIADAIEHHRVPPERVRIVGAYVFDKWLAPGVLTPREEFCRGHGLRPEDPIVVWLGASRNIASDESWAIRGLRSALDASPDPRLRRSQIIVRPHPANAAIYERLDLRDTVVVPRGGSSPDPGAGQQLFYDCVHHALAATGIYTSAMMDAVILGRPVAVLTTERYRATQREAQYFRTLAESGAIACADSFEGLRDHLSGLLDGVDPERAPREKFARTYVWPWRDRRPASAVVADEFEKLVSTRFQ